SRYRSYVNYSPKEWTICERYCVSFSWNSMVFLNVSNVKNTSPGTDASGAKKSLKLYVKGLSWSTTVRFDENTSGSVGFVFIEVTPSTFHNVANAAMNWSLSGPVRIKVIAPVVKPACSFTEPS